MDAWARRIESVHHRNIGAAFAHPTLYALSPIFFSRGNTSSQKYGSSSA
jgi:hypothetical protein